MSIEKKYSKLLNQARQSVAYWTQAAKRDFTDDLLKWMSERKVSQARLAHALDVSPQFVTKVLRTNANLTIETMTKIAMAVGCQIRIHLAPRGASTVWRDYPDNITHLDVPMHGKVVPIQCARTNMRGPPEPPQTINVPTAANW